MAYRYNAISGQIDIISTSGGTGTGNVVGPSSSVAGNFPAFGDTTGKTLVDSLFSPEDFLRAENNLSDVADKTESFDTIAPGTTKGDLIVFNGTNNVRVPIGSNGQVLTANSAQASGVDWTAGSSGLTTLTTTAGIATVTSGNVNFVNGPNITLSANSNVFQVALNDAVYLPNGSVTNPPYSFGNRPQDGLYNDGSQACIAWSGNPCMKFGFTSQVYNTLETYGGITLNRDFVNVSPYNAPTGVIWISVDTTSPRTILLPNSPRANQYFLVKDFSGMAATNPIHVTTPSGTIAFDQGTSVDISVNSAVKTFLFNGTGYEVG